jgi:hypothetical protein
MFTVVPRHDDFSKNGILIEFHVSKVVKRA